MTPFPSDPLKVYPPLPGDIKAQLRRIEPSLGGLPGLLCRYYPCSVTLNSGDIVDRVYLAEARSWYSLWGVWPEDDEDKSWVGVRDIRSVAESPERLPVRFANELYEAGESSMGGVLFTVTFVDGAQQAYSAGGAVDFITYPVGKGPSDVSAVTAHERDVPNRIRCPRYYWCLFSDEAP
jgi:hypothetical protein